MNLFVHFIELDSDFDQEYADTKHNGEESEENIKYSWEDELKVNGDVIDMKIINNATYTLKGVFADNKPFSFDIPNVSICEYQFKSGEKEQFAVSKKLIKKTDKKTLKNGDMHFYFFLKDTFEVENPIDGLYIIEEDFPKELLA
jgi:hypothetical protein